MMKKYSSTKRSVAILLPEVPILVPILSRQIVVTNSALKSISGVFLALSSLFKYSCHITGALIYAKESGKWASLWRRDFRLLNSVTILNFDY